jgi:hypothetical protein
MHPTMLDGFSQRLKRLKEVDMGLSIAAATALRAIRVPTRLEVEVSYQRTTITNFDILLQRLLE